MANVPQTYAQMLDAKRDDLAKLLPDYLKIDTFIHNARNLATDPNLRSASADKLLECAFDAARRGLEIGGPNKHCAVVAFKSTPVLIVQWQGKSFLWQKSGAIKKLRAHVVYKWDEFEYDAGAERIRHIPDLEGQHSAKELNDINNIRCAYAEAVLWSGEKALSVVTRDQLIRLRDWVAAKNNGNLGFGWRDWLPEMCCKTAVHRLEGFVQPPPSLSAEQIDAWNRASYKDTSFDAETEGRPVDANIDHPVDTEGNGAPQPGLPTGQVGTAGLQPQVRNPEVVSDDDSDDRFVNNDEIREMAKYCDEHGVPLSQLRSILKKKFEVDDISKLRFGYVGMLRAEIEAAGNG